MPTQALLPFVESPEGLTQDSLSSKSANIPESGSSMTPHATYPSKTVAQCGANDSPSCMFCDETFSHQEEVGHHVLTQHPTTFFEPAVLRIEAEFRIPGQRTRSKPSSSALEKEEVHTCIVCGLVSQDASELETHLRKHKDYFTYCCNVCGRRFREPWFLKNHMKMHGKSGAKSKALQDQEGPVTVNGVVQEPVSEPVVTAYKMCMVCGFFFPDHSSLVEHSKVHNREVGPDKDGDSESKGTATESMTQQSFFQSLSLKPCLTGKSLQHERTSKWIPQLDPYNTFQAWQLATRGKIAVGPITMKEMGPEASTDNEDCSSDKEQMSSSWSDGQGDKNTKEVLGRELRSQQQAVAAILEPQLPQRRSLMQKNKEIERPTTCHECQRSFKTYHQLVLHSRVHKREGGGEERPTVPAEGTLSRAASAADMENGAEEGFETGEDSFYHSKERSKHCSFCGKSFRSSYYLTVHLRTHTGEKPYKCVYCDYAAAQRTSLKYHLERRHKDKPYVEIPSKPDMSLPSPSDGKGNSSMKRSKPWLSVAKGELQDKSQSRGGELDKVAAQNDDEHEKVIANQAFNTTENVTMKSPVAVNLKVEKEEIKDENCEAPINLSRKVCLSIPASAQPRNASVPSVCSFCTYKTIYPEVLMMHKRLTHKDKCGGARKNTYGKQRRLTGCPPALLGKDVTPLPMIDRRQPRRTKSPPPQPTKPKEMMPANLPHATKAIHTPLYVGPHERKRFRHNGESQFDQESDHLNGQVRKSSVAGMYQTKQPTTFTKVAAAERSFPERSAAMWQSDAAHLLLSSQFGSLPQIGEPSSKRLKQILPIRGVDIGLRGPPPSDGRIRLRLQGSGVQGMSERSHPPADILAPLKSTAIGGGLDADWNMMNLLRACTPNNLASLYHGVPANQNHVGLAHPRAGARSALFQHLPTLPILPRRESPAPVSEQHSGTSDNTT